MLSPVRLSLLFPNTFSLSSNTCAARTASIIHRSQFPPQASQFFIYYYHKIRNFVY
jgi:hypothetical protein